MLVLLGAIGVGRMELIMISGSVIIIIIVIIMMMCSNIVVYKTARYVT